MRPLPNRRRADRREAGRTPAAWLERDEDPDLADDEDWIAVQEF